MAEAPRPSTVYELGTVAASTLHHVTRLETAATLCVCTPHQWRKKCRPTCIRNRPRFGAQTASTPLKHWGGPHRSADSFTMPSDLFDPNMASIRALSASCFDDGTTWIDLDLHDGGASHLRFQCQRFIESGMSRDGKRMSGRTLKQLALR